MAYLNGVNDAIRGAINLLEQAYEEDNLPAFEHIENAMSILNQARIALGQKVNKNLKTLR